MRLNRQELLEKAHESSVWSLAWCPDQTLLTGSLDESVILWTEDSATGTLRKKHTFLCTPLLPGFSHPVLLPAHGLGTVNLAVHKEGRYAASSCLDGCVRVWDIQDTSKKLHHFQAAASENWGIDFAPTAERVILAVAGGMTSSISVYALGEETKKQMTLQLPRVCKQIQVSAFCGVGEDSELLVTGSDAACVTIYDVVSGTVTASIDSRVVKDAGPYEDPSMFLDLSFHPDGQHFTSCTAHGKIYLWEMASRERLQVLEDHGDAVWCAQFRPDGAKMASACEDGSLGLFSVMAT